MTTNKEIKDQVVDAIDAAMGKYKPNGTNGRAMPKTIYEFLWQGAQTFGIPSIAFGVILVIVYQTFPAWVNANIETQTSLSKNLNRQTDNLVSLGNTLENLQSYGRETEVFRKEVAVEHDEMAKELHAVKMATDTICIEQTRQREEHRAIVETLKQLCDTLKNSGKAPPN